MNSHFPNSFKWLGDESGAQGGAGAPGRAVVVNAKRRGKKMDLPASSGMIMEATFAMPQRETRSAQETPTAAETSCKARRMRKLSQGMLGMIGGRRSGRVHLWNEVAPLLETVWAADGERTGACAGEAEAMLQVAEAAGVCSFAQTIEGARQFLLEQGGARMLALARQALNERLPYEAIRALTLNVVDEGHTAAVVRAEVALSKRPALVLALLVARDLGTAAAKLGAQASDLRVWHRMSPRRAAEVMDEGTGCIRWFGQAREVPVIAAQWIEGETLFPSVFEGLRHGRRRQAAGSLGPLAGMSGSATTQDMGDVASEAVAAVAAASEAAAGCGVCEVVQDTPSGRMSREELAAKCGEREVLALCLARQLAELRSALATFALDGACERMIDLEQGNAMLDRQGTVVLVGSAARSWCGALGAWPYRLAGALMGPSRGEEIAVRPLVAEAVLAGLAAVARRPGGEAIAAAMLQQARSLDVGKRALEGLVPAEAREQIAAAVLELLPAAQAQLERGQQR